jgi:hypothetical protein
VREGQAAQLLAVELEHERVGDGERGAAVGRLGEQRHGAEVAARTVVEHEHLLAGDLARRLEPAVEDDVKALARSPRRKRNSPAASLRSRPRRARRSSSSAPRLAKTGMSRSRSVVTAPIDRP